MEDALGNTYAGQRGKNAAERRERAAELGASGGYKILLNEAPSVVRQVWSDSIGTVSRVVRENLANGADVFLTFHAVYYADKFGDFYSPLDPVPVAALPKPARVFCLIDDIGDVAHRLRREGQVFANRSKTDLDSVLDALRDLLTILEWRSAELTVTRLVARLVGEVPLVLAVKHPLITALRLLEGGGTPTYISHSISEARRTWRRDGNWPPFMKEVQRFTDSLGNRAGAQAIPILPTTVDEYRLLERAFGRERLLLPMTGARWQLPGGPLLVDDAPTDKWLDPRGHFDPELLNQKKIPNKTIRELRTIHGLLHALATRIDNQVNARDHTLVEQCPALIVYRPYYAWRVSTGVAAEVKHQRDRLKTAFRRRRTITFIHKRPDDFRLRSLGRILSGCRAFKWVRGEAQVPWATVEELLKNGLDAAQPASFEAEAIRQRVLEITQSEGLEIDGFVDAAAEPPVLGKLTSVESEESVDSAWQRIAAAVAERDHWKDDVDDWIEADSTPEEFAARVCKPPHQKNEARKNRKR